MNRKVAGLKRSVILSYLYQYSASLRPYASHYAQFWGLTEDNKHFGYLCPICLINGFWVTADDTFHSRGLEFSMDHYPPESVGGFQTIAVCKTCNNYAGDHYDFALKQKLAELSFNSQFPGSTLRTKSVIGKIPGKYSSTISIRPDGSFEVSFKPNQKAHTPHLDSWLDQSSKDPTWKADVTIPLIDEKLVGKALLKAAFLYAFAAWGYEFAFSYTGCKIRKVICDNDRYPLDVPSFWLGGQAPPGTKLPVGVCYAYNNMVFRCFVVNIPLRDLTTGYSNLVSVLLPGPAVADWESLMRLGPGFERYGEVTFSMAHVTEHLLGPNEIDGYAKSWSLLHTKA